jgi:hypothetical protein
MIPFIGNKAYHWLMYVLKGYQDMPPEFYALSDEGATTFDHKSNVGLHHFALEVASEEVLHAMHKKVADYPGVKMEFNPEHLGEGPAKHCIFYEPGGIRMEFIWAGQ